MVTAGTIAEQHNGEQSRIQGIGLLCSHSHGEDTREEGRDLSNIGPPLEYFWPYPVFEAVGYGEI